MFWKAVTICITGGYLFQLGLDLIDYASTHKHVPCPWQLWMLVLTAIGISNWPRKEK